MMYILLHVTKNMQFIPERRRTMKELIANIIDVIVVALALFAVIFIIQWMTTINGENGATKDGIITQQMTDTVTNVFDIVDESLGVSESD